MVYFRALILIFLSTFLVTMSTAHEVTYTSVTSFENSAIGSRLSTRPGDLTAILKDEFELARYLRCQIAHGERTEAKPGSRVALARMKEFNALYRPFIKQASETFEMPYALTACILLKETFIDNSKTSPVGASTVAQFMPGTYEHLLNMYRQTKHKEDSYQQFLQMNKDQPTLDIFESKSPNFFIRCNQFASRKGYWYNAVIDSEKIRSQSNCSSQLRDFAINHDLIKELETFIIDASKNMDEATYTRYFKNPRSKGGPRGDDLVPPTSFSSLKEKPMWIMAMNMYYLKYMLSSVNSYFNPEGFQSSKDILGYLAIIGGSYNLGEGVLIKEVQKAGGSIKKYCEAVANNEETSDYILALKRCMAKESHARLPGLRNESECPDQEAGSQYTFEKPCDTLPDTSPAISPTGSPGSSTGSRDEVSQ